MSSEEAEQQQAPAREAGKRQAENIALGKYIRIEPDNRLPQYDRATAHAYAASDTRTPGTALYALVCEESAPPRIDVLSTLSRIEGLPVVVPADWDVVDWPRTGARRFAVAFERPSGEPLIAGPDASFRPWREEQVVEQVIAPLAKVLREFDGRGVTHRGICLENLFSASARNEAVLGECVGMPAGMMQPTLYETIPGGQAVPEGRGEGTAADDLYALGVLVAVLLRGGNPMAGWRDHDILASKIANGSYVALLGQASLSLKLMEPLRGLLCDAEDERWVLEDLEMWLNGRHLSPKQANLPGKARRSFHFEGHDHWGPRSLSHAMTANWQAALQVMREGALDHWVQRSIVDEKQSARVRAILVGGQVSQGGSEDRTLMRLLIALDPAAPIRHRDLAARVEALPLFLAMNLQDEAQCKRVAEVISSKLPQYWLELQGDQASPQLLQGFERMNFFLSRSQMGYGLERCVYEFNPEWPCLSPLVRGQFVHRIERLLPVLEALAAGGKLGNEPIDRHIVAFLGARMNPQPERILQGLADAQDRVSRRRAVMHLLARAQRRHGPQKMPAFTRWIAEYAGPVVESLRNRKLRERAHKGLDRAVENGSLVELVSAVDDPEARRRDAEGFAAAKSEYQRVSREITALEQGSLTAPRRVAEAAGSTSAAVSAVVSGLVLMCLALFYVA